MVGGDIAMGGRRRVAPRALLASLCAVVALAVVGAGPALAAPTVVIEAPANGSFTSSTTPVISGTTTYTPLVPAPVTVNVYPGTSATGKPAQTLVATPSEGGQWSAGASLGQGTYTAVAEQTELTETGSTEVTFTIKTTPPAVGLNPVASPTAESRPTLTGAAGKAEGDIQKVTVTIYDGEAVGGGVAASGTVEPTGGEWTYQPASALKDGTYTAQASQEDKAGNKGTSEAATFTIKAAAPKVTLDSVPSPSNDSTPTLKGAAGTATGDLQTVNVKIYEGGSVGTGVAVAGEAAVSGGEWKFTPASALTDGTYTAQAEQKDNAGNTGKSEPKTFTIDTLAPLVTLDPVPSPSNNAKPTLKGKAGTETGDLHSVAVTIYEGSGTGGSIVSSGSVVPSGSSWSYAPNAELSDGTYTARAEQEDAAGNLGKSATQTFTVKASKPVVTLNPPAALSNNATPSFGGNADTRAGNIQSVTVRVYAGSEASGSAVRALSVSASEGKWEAGPVEHLPDGTYTAQAEQQDQVGNTGVSAPATFTIDTAPPKISLSAVPTPTNDSMPTLEGVRGTGPHDDAAVSVTVYAGSSVGGTVAAASSFSVSGAAWSYTTPHLIDGTYTAQAEQKDTVGNVGKSAAVTFTIDTGVPEVTLDAVPTPSNNPTPHLSGTAGNDSIDGAVKVTIYAGATVGGSVANSGTAQRSGESWTYTPSHLPDGTYTALATQQDAAGNVGTSASHTFTISTASPTVTLNSPAPVSNNTTPSFSGTASDTTPVTITVHQGPTTSGTVAWTATVGVIGGSWSSEAVSPPLADGQYTAIATQPSSLGNPDGKSAPVTFKINTAAPTVTMAQPLSPSNNTHPSFSGTASDTTAVLVKVYEGKQPTGTAVAEVSATPVGEAWSTTPVALKEGKHTYTAVAIQKSSISGNPEGTSVPVTFILETTAPTVTLNAQPKPRSNVATPSFTGTASDLSSVTVNVYKGNAVKGSPVTSASGVPATGVWTSGPTLASLADGEYTAQATQPSSIIGNPAGVSAPINFIIDTKAPAVSMTPLKPQINTPGPELTGHVGTEKGDIAKVAVKVYKNAEAVGGVVVGGEVVLEGEATITTIGSATAWSYKSSNLPDGTYIAQATQADEAENTGHSVPVTFTIDTVAPTVTLNAPAAKSNNRAPTFTGTASETTPVTVAIYNEKGVEVSRATAPGTGGAWTSAPATPELPNIKGKQAYTAAATQTDEAGNTTTTSPRVKFVVDTEAPTLTLNRPPARTNNRTPSFTGTASDTTTVTIKVYAPGGTEVAKATAPGTGGAWSSAAINTSLPDGPYTVAAFQESAFGNHSSETERMPFTVDTVAPQVTINYPPSGARSTGGSQLVGGSAGASEGDLPNVTVRLFAGEAVGSPIQTVVVPLVGKAWSATFAGLPAGAYTARAEQADEAGNVGVSGTDTFYLSAPAVAVGHPSASFSWYPPAPHAGERVSLVSSSTDPTSPLTALAWDLAGTGSFQPGGQVVNTSFATAGNHVVHLRVTDAANASGVATETIPVGAPQAVLMQPFPLVRIVTTRSGSGLKLRVLSILAAPGARVTITCKGHHCPVKRQSKIAAAGKVGLASVSFHRFEQALPAGTTLEIRVSKPGEVGKYTKLSIRRGGVLKRIDACLQADGVKPIPCPSG